MALSLLLLVSVVEPFFSVCVVSSTSCNVVTSRFVVKLVDVVFVSICKSVYISRSVLLSPSRDVVVSKGDLVVV